MELENYKVAGFNIMRDPCIPVIFVDGSSKEISTLECIEKAHEIKKISEKKPYETLALLRFLVAMAADAYQPERKRDRQVLYEQGRFDINVVKTYIKKCEEEYGASFDLFHPTRPCMGYAYNPLYDNEDSKMSAAYIHLELAHGSNATHLAADTEADFKGDTPAEFFRALLAANLFPWGCAMKGANSATGTNCYIKEYDEEGNPKYSMSYGSMGVNAGHSMAATWPTYFWPNKETLFSTIVSCMRSKKELGNLSMSNPPAPWNSNRVPNSQKTKRGDDSLGISFVSGLTYQSRRIVPIVDEDGLIRQCYISNAYVNPDDVLWHDPFVARLRKKDGTAFYNLCPDGSRAMWRNIGNLTASNETASHLMPDVLKPLYESDTSKIVNISSLGFTPKDHNGGFDMMIFDKTINIPEPYLENDELGDFLLQEVNLIEKVSKCWDSISIKALCGGKSKATGKYEDIALSSYWLALSQFLFDSENGFLSKIVELYNNNALTYQQEANKLLLEYLDNTMKQICIDIRSRFGSWEKIIQISGHLYGQNGCLSKYHKFTKPYRIDKEEETA